MRGLLILILLLPLNVALAQGFDRRLENQAIAGEVNLIKAGANPEDPMMLGIVYNPTSLSYQKPSEYYQTFGFYDPVRNVLRESDLFNSRNEIDDVLIQNEGPMLCLSHSGWTHSNHFRALLFEVIPGDSSYRGVINELSDRNIVSNSFSEWRGRYFILVNDSSRWDHYYIRQFNLLEIDTTDFSTTKLAEFSYPKGLEHKVSFRLSPDGRGIDIWPFSSDSIVHYEIGIETPQSYLPFKAYSWTVFKRHPFNYVLIDSAGLQLIQLESATEEPNLLERYNFNTELDNVVGLSNNGIYLQGLNPYNTIQGGHYDRDSNLTAIGQEGEICHVYKLNKEGKLLFHHKVEMYANVVHSFADGSYYLGGHFFYPPHRFQISAYREPRLVYVDPYGRSQTVIGDESFQVHFHASTNQLKLFLNNPLIQAQYRISDASGRIMQEGAVDTYENLDLGDWQTGIYRIQLWTQTGVYLGSKPFLMN